MDIANLNKSYVRGHYTDEFGITHYAPNWDLSILRHVYSKHKSIQNKIDFEEFCFVVNDFTNRYYFVFMSCYPKISEGELFDMIIHEVYAALKVVTC